MKKNILIVLFILFFGLLFLFSRGGPAPTFLSAAPQGSAEKEEIKKEPDVSGNVNGNGLPAVEIPPEKQQLLGVRKAEVSIKPFHKVIRTVGIVSLDETKLATVNTKVEGWIEKLYADYQGKYVKKGEKLAEVYSPELYATQLEFVNLLNWKTEKAHRFQRNVEFNWGDRYGTTGRILTFDIEALFQVARQKLQLWEITEEQIQQIEEKRTPMKHLTLHSPITGYIIQKQVVEGTRIQPGDKLFDIADLSTLWVIADIYSYEMPLVRVGQTAKIRLSHLPSREFVSKIDYVYPTLSGETRTVRVRFTLPNPDGSLKPQMFTDIEIKVDLGKRLVIPEDAVIDAGTRKIIYLDKGDGYFEPREVVLGLRGDGLVEVIKGLKSGDRVVSAANFLIDSEAKLKGITQ
jgi:Cu(I)/Ag(I) efflux system membrane fusion protein